MLSYWFLCESDKALVGHTLKVQHFSHIAHVSGPHHRHHSPPAAVSGTAIITWQLFCTPAPVSPLAISSPQPGINYKSGLTGTLEHYPQPLISKHPSTHRELRRGPPFTIHSVTCFMIDSRWGLVLCKAPTFYFLVLAPKQWQWPPCGGHLHRFLDLGWMQKKGRIIFIFGIIFIFTNSSRGKKCGKL